MFSTVLIPAAESICFITPPYATPRQSVDAMGVDIFGGGGGGYRAVFMVTAGAVYDERRDVDAPAG